MSHNLSELAGLREQILENYRVIDPTNANALLIITLRKKNPEELLLYPFVTYRTEDMFEAILISSSIKGKEILMSDVSPWDTPIPALDKLLRQTCKILGEKISEDKH